MPPLTIRASGKEKGMSQTVEILRHLAKGKPITPLEALERFGAFRLAARIQEIRSQGHKVETKKVRTKSGARVARYSLCR